MENVVRPEDYKAENLRLRKLIRKAAKAIKKYKADQENIHPFSFLSSSANPMVAVRSNGKIIFTNDLFSETFGLTNQISENLYLTELIPSGSIVIEEYIEVEKVSFVVFDSKKLNKHFKFQPFSKGSKDGIPFYTFILVDHTHVIDELNNLEERASESAIAAQEFKKVIDKQLETNEQLLIAESQLKTLLEKEHESKAILNQTIEALKDTQGQLVHSEKMASIGQLTAGIAHEINNPINFIYNGIGSLKTNLGDLSEILDTYTELEDGGDPDEIRKRIISLKDELEYDELRNSLEELLIDIKEGAVRTIEIVKGLRIFSRLDEEAQKKADINECLNATIVLLKNKTKNHIHVERHLDESIPQIMCFPGQLNQVFMNMINNAIQAIPEDQKDGEIKISTSQDDKRVIIQISDNGMGMSEETQKRVFEPFYTTKPVGVGTGLGMSISFGIIEKHDGSIQVKSAVGEGTSFQIALPKYEVELARVI